MSSNDDMKFKHEKQEKKDFKEKKNKRKNRARIIKNESGGRIVCSRCGTKYPFMVGSPYESLFYRSMDLNMNQSADKKKKFKCRKENGGCTNLRGKVELKYGPLSRLF